MLSPFDAVTMSTCCALAAIALKEKTCGQSYKHSMIANYNTSVTLTITLTNFFITTIGPLNNLIER